MAMLYDFTVKTLPDLRDWVFPMDDIASKDALENAVLLNGYDLFTYYPPKYEDKNKIALFEHLLQKKKYKPAKQNILITRFYPKQLPINYTIEQHNDKSKSYTFISNTFDYKPSEESNVVEWHMNFANCDIFAFYRTSLLAQDELQVLECPQLASLREYFNQQNDSKLSGKKVFNAQVIEGNLPYPILISNIERVVELNTTNLYGNNFSASSEATVMKSCKYLKQPQIINIIAIEAPKYGQGLYTPEQIKYILHECYTAYAAAISLANKTSALNNQRNPTSPIKTYIHSGWFGCGAYGGNRIIMIILQILAAKMAGIDRLVLHTVTSNFRQDIDAAETCLGSIFNTNQTSLSMDDVIDRVVTENFVWGSSNGT